MIRFFILFGFSFMFFMLHYTGDIDKYINMKYAYLSISAVVIMGLLSIFEFVRVSRQQIAEEKKQAAALDGKCYHDEQSEHDGHGHAHTHNHAHHAIHDYHDQHDHGHSHGNDTKLKRFFGYLILFVPILTGLFLPAAALDSSFVKAKGFSFPSFEENMENNPGAHQFLKPDSSVFYRKDDYVNVKNKELAQFMDRPSVILTDEDYLKGMEVIYNTPEAFMGKTIGFDGFAYKGQQVDGNHYFVFRFGFIHCVADSGVFGMLVEFPKNTQINDDDWVHVSGKLSWELYQPFKQTIPVLKVADWKSIEPPKDPYVYRST
ncbi:TIGR03943 family putative permease subunit [Paenibacillus sp. PL91]|uniref:TIGR03943 family putative permease subunit n=1 Tax=Paenibacillus sp. PL91 TaxID=2729538 RepID=UPI00145C6510|nr:TIGR03943 family protein [Paenibacillus sp. PL91]MBC9199108.1 TIGR03943 family protein [Paenibacillus sp. PL91]